MSEASVSNVHNWRLAVALAIVAGIVFAPIFIDRLLDGQAGTGAPAGIVEPAVGAAGDPDSVLDQMEDRLAADSAAMPSGFEEEIGMLPGARDLRVSQDGVVVGYVVDGQADDIASLLDERLAERGWKPVSLGGVEGATYVKSEGSYTWMLATVTQVANSSSVVMRCA